MSKVSGIKTFYSQKCSELILGQYKKCLEKKCFAPSEKFSRFKCLPSKKKYYFITKVFFKCSRVQKGHPQLLNQELRKACDKVS